MSSEGLTPEEQRKRKFANDCYAKGTQAMAKENWDYAVEMLSTAVKLVSDNLMFRQILRNCEYRKYKNNKTGAGSMSFLKVNSARSKVKKARSAKNWTELDLAAEEGLQLNPWDAQFNADLAEACHERGFGELAIYAYQKACESAPDNKDLWRRLAEVCEDRGDYTQAANCWQKITKLDPLDGEARSRYTQTAAKEVIERKYDEAKNTQDVKAPKMGYEESVKGDAASKPSVLAPGESVENDLQRAIKKEPGNTAHYQKLSEYYRREGRLEESVRTLKQALDLSGNQDIREQMEDVELDMVRKNLEIAREIVKNNPADEDAKESAVALANELIKQEIEVFARRTERYPNDMKVKNELAQRYVRVNKVALAIPLFQQATKDSRLETSALVSLGECFLKQQQNGLAKRQFEKAAEKLNGNEHPEQYKKCHYLLGRLAEQAGENEKAEAHYTDVLGVDYGYKDTVARLEKIQGAGGKTGGIDLDGG